MSADDPESLRMLRGSKSSGGCDAGQRWRDQSMSKTHEETLPAYLNRHRILSLRQTASLYDISVVHLRRLIKGKKVPEPIRIGERKLGFVAGVVLDDIARRTSSAA